MLPSATVRKFTLGFSSKSDFGGNFQKSGLHAMKKRIISTIKFPSSLVTRLTGLQRDSLHLFMLHYQPSYKFCRKSSQEDILLYINDKFKLFMKKP